jgi:hypothetical protein
MTSSFFLTADSPARREPAKLETGKACRRRQDRPTKFDECGLADLAQSMTEELDNQLCKSLHAGHERPTRARPQASK